MTFVCSARSIQLFCLASGGSPYGSSWHVSVFTQEQTVKDEVNARFPGGCTDFRVSGQSFDAYVW